MGLYESRSRRDRDDFRDVSPPDKYTVLAAGDGASILYGVITLLSITLSDTLGEFEALFTRVDACDNRRVSIILDN